MANIEAYARPNRLFRYRPLSDKTIEREIAALERNHIYCSQYSKMNDPMEGINRTSFLFRKSKGYQVKLDEVRDHISKLGIASLSEDKKLEPMWAYYAGGFSGICVAYSTSKLLSGLPDDLELIKMTYSEAPPILLRNKQSSEFRAKLTLSTKTLRWSSEREWRLINPQVGPAVSKLKGTVTAIYLGERIKPAHSDLIKCCANTIKVPVYQMKIHRYEMRFHRLRKSNARPIEQTG